MTVDVKRPAQVVVELPFELLDRLYSQADVEERPINAIVSDAVQFYFLGRLYGVPRTTSQRPNAA